MKKEINIKVKFITFYKFYVTEPDPVVIPEPETEKEKGYQYTPKTSPSNDYAFWGTVVGIVIIGGILWRRISLVAELELLTMLQALHLHIN